MGGGLQKKRFKYERKHLVFLCDYYPRLPLPQLTEAFNQRFNAGVSKEAIKSVLGRYGFRSGRDGRFKKGQASWNKGLKGYMGPNRTSFKPGNLPANHRPLWSERICSRDGYVLMSVPERNPHTGFPTRFKHKHVWLWERAHGRRVPAGHVVMFLDGDKYNFSLDNLILVTRKELLHLNQHHYHDQPAELKPSVMALAKLEAKAGFSLSDRGRKKTREGGNDDVSGIDG